MDCFPEEQKGSHKWTKGDLFFTNQHILKESKAILKNVAMAWTDNKKANDIVP